MAGKHQVHLGAIQETLFIPLLARARETRRRRPALRDPRAVEMVESIEYDFTRCRRWPGAPMVVLRTLILDAWVRAFLAEHPAGTVVELGTGLNTRFERVDNGTVHWIDLDLPDTIALRREFFADTDRRRMLAASALDEDWHRVVADHPGPYLFVTEGVLVYLPAREVERALARLAERFPGALLALDTYTDRARRMRARRLRRGGRQAHELAGSGGLDLPWTVDDPDALERLGLRRLDTVALPGLPRALRAQLPARYRYLLPLFAPLLRGLFRLTLLRASPRSSE